MIPLLLTGASGQLGRRLLPRLIEAGYDVRAHYRSREKIDKYCPSCAQAIIGDLRTPDWLDEATKGREVVIHGAARVSLRPGNYDEQRLVNIEGTRAVIESCRKNHVRRLIYISSIVTIGASGDGKPIDETYPFNLHGYGIPYIETKRAAEDLVLAANGPGLQVVVVNPSIMISPPDRPVTKTDLRKIPRFLPAYFDFSLNVVETDDVITGLIACIERGRPGERYLLTGENIDQNRAFELARTYFGIGKPILKIPISALWLFGCAAELAAWIRGKRPKFHRGLAKLARLKFVYSNHKARRELGFNPRPLEESIARILKNINR